MDDLELLENLFKRAVAEVEREELARARETARPSEDAASLAPDPTNKYALSRRTGGPAPAAVRGDSKLARQLRSSLDRGALAMERRRARSR